MVEKINKSIEKISTNESAGSSTKAVLTSSQLTISNIERNIHNISKHINALDIEVEDMLEYLDGGHSEFDEPYVHEISEILTNFDYDLDKLNSKLLKQIKNLNI